MGKLLIRKWGSFFLVLMLAVSVSMLTGCDGDDGAPGADGKSAYEIAVDNGFVGTEQEWLDSLTPVADTATPESCGVCHNDIAMTHMPALRTSDVDVTVAAPVDNAGALDIDFDLEVDGVGIAGYAVRRVYAYYDAGLVVPTTPTDRSSFERDTLCSGTADCAASAFVTLADIGAGSYTVTISDDAVTPDVNVYADAVYLIQMEGADGTRPIVVTENGAPAIRDLVSNTGCQSCHGDYVFNDGHYTVAAEYCQVCHVRSGRDFYIADTAEQNANCDDDDPATICNNEGDGGNLPIYVHGVHNSHNMPAGVAYFHGEEWSVGYPSNMWNCVTCHQTPAQLDAAVTAPVDFYLCMSCHQSWDGFTHTHDAADGSYEAGDMIFAANNFHRSADINTDCMSCHAAVASLDEVGDFHNDFQGTDAHYDSFYRGVDISFANPNDLTYEITGVTSDGKNVSFTWTVSDASGPIDPCTESARFEQLRTYLAYAKGDDWVNEFAGSAPGQPGSSPRPFPDNTTCAAAAPFTATTTGLTLNAEAVAYADKVGLVLSGKPLDTITVEATDRDFFVRVPSSVYAFDAATGDQLEGRRDAVDNAKCLNCHQGTLYQHGGDRVDNEQHCVVCHNPASNDKNNRLERYAIVNDDGKVNTDATYDGLTAQTYDLRHMLHAIHGISKREDPWTIYRGRGIYMFANPDTQKPTGWPGEGPDLPIYGSTNDSTQTHNWTVVHFPRLVNECEACHNEGLYEAPDQTKAVALTTDAGTDWPDQSDDRVIGPTAAACTGCHYNAAVRSHAKQFGYDAKVTKDEMLELSK